METETKNKLSTDNEPSLKNMDFNLGILNMHMHIWFLITSQQIFFSTQSYVILDPKVWLKLSSMIPRYMISVPEISGSLPILWDLPTIARRRDQILGVQTLSPLHQDYFVEINLTVFERKPKIEH